MSGATLRSRKVLHWRVVRVDEELVRELGSSILKLERVGSWKMLQLRRTFHPLYIKSLKPALNGRLILDDSVENKLTSSYGIRGSCSVLCLVTGKLLPVVPIPRTVPHPGTAQPRGWCFSCDFHGPVSREDWNRVVIPSSFKFKYIQGSDHSSDNR